MFKFKRELRHNSKCNVMQDPHWTLVWRGKNYIGHLDWGLHDFWGLDNCATYGSILSIEENVIFWRFILKYLGVKWHDVYNLLLNGSARLWMKHMGQKYKIPWNLGGGIYELNVLLQYSIGLKIFIIKTPEWVEIIYRMQWDYILIKFFSSISSTNISLKFP